MKIKNLTSKLFITAAVLIFAILLNVFKIHCPIRYAFGIACPGCGMTRAVISALRLDFASAFSYHLMFWSLPLLFWCFLKDGKLFRSKALNVAFYILIAFGFAVNWIFY
ncbi:MAG: DUF2752 domain-containing protein [Clostridia bacterium]|nr:DUF2752 domain-containing protein [Clostridia bacterium]